MGEEDRVEKSMYVDMEHVQTCFRLRLTEVSALTEWVYSGIRS